METTRTIKLDQEINATEQEVFDALTKAEILEQWFPTKAKTHPVQGGEYWFNFEYNDPYYAAQRNHTRTGHFVEIIPNQTIVFDWMERTLVTFTLSKTDRGTKVELIHSGWNLPTDDSVLESHLEGWTDYLLNLQSVLETGTDIRPDKLKMKTKEHPNLVTEI